MQRSRPFNQEHVPSIYKNISHLEWFMIFYSPTYCYDNVDTCIVWSPIGSTIWIMVYTLLISLLLVCIFIIVIPIPIRTCLYIEMAVCFLLKRDYSLIPRMVLVGVYWGSMYCTLWEHSLYINILSCLYSWLEVSYWNMWSDSNTPRC